MMYLLRHQLHRGGGAYHKIKLAALLDYKYETGLDRSDQMLSLFVQKEDNKMVEETFLSSIRPVSGQCTHPA